MNTVIRKRHRGTARALPCLKLEPMVSFFPPFRVSGAVTWEGLVL